MSASRIFAALTVWPGRQLNKRILYLVDLTTFGILSLRDGHSTIETLKQLSDVYAKNGQNTRQQRAAYWNTQLGKDHFDSWSEVLKDFEG